jgi:hypothetical protein
MVRLLRGHPFFHTGDPYPKTPRARGNVQKGEIRAAGDLARGGYGRVRDHDKEPTASLREPFGKARERR